MYKNLNDLELAPEWRFDFEGVNPSLNTIGYYKNNPVFLRNQIIFTEDYVSNFLSPFENCLIFCNGINTPQSIISKNKSSIYICIDNVDEAFIKFRQLNPDFCNPSLINENELKYQNTDKRSIIRRTAFYGKRPKIGYNCFIGIEGGSKMGMYSIGGVSIYGNVTIDSNVTIYRGITGFTTIDDNLYIPSGVTIMPNAHVTKDTNLLPNCIVYA